MLYIFRITDKNGNLDGLTWGHEYGTRAALYGALTRARKRIIAKYGRDIDRIEARPVDIEAAGMRYAMVYGNNGRC